MPESAPFDAATFLQGVPPAPGVYRMCDAKGTILYVGKARNLKKRVSSYFGRSPAEERIRRMVAQVHDVEVTVTATEADALLLENTLIKQHSPYYNVLLRDDKSYPYLYVSTQQEYPSLAFVRGRRKSGRMFGPYSSVGALRDTMNLLQKLFRVRQCADSVFHNRTRPCLQYQIDRCTAPCVNYIKPEEYRADVELTMRFLEGKNEEVMENMTARMDQAAAEQNYEQAAAWRDRIAAVQQVCRHYHIGVAAHSFDVIAVACEGGAVCVEVASFREGLHHGTRSYFPRIEDVALAPAEILRGFLGQYYLERKAPREILLNETIRDAAAMAQWLSDKGGAQVQLQSAPRGRRRDQLDLAYANALQSLRTRLQTQAGIAAQLRELGDVLGLDAPPERLECFDVSHTRGEQAVASCVVFGTEGPQPDEYRRFNLEGFTPGDDYAAMRQALERRYKRVAAGEVPAPDVLFVDGGAGQVHVARAALAAVGIDQVPVVGVAKGAGRKPGLETLHAETLDEPLQLPPNNGALHVIQQLRDEAHRFAITGHRKRRAKRRQESVLEEIPGVGPRRRQDLLRHFGGWQGVRGASVRELSSVPGIGSELATAIHDHLHTQA